MNTLHAFLVGNANHVFWLYSYNEGTTVGCTHSARISELRGLRTEGKVLLFIEGRGALCASHRTEAVGFLEFLRIGFWDSFVMKFSSNCGIVLFSVSLNKVSELLRESDAHACGNLAHLVFQLRVRHLVQAMGVDDLLLFSKAAHFG